MESTCNRQWKKGWKCTRGLHETGPCALLPEIRPIPERWREHYQACKDNLEWKQNEGKAGHTQQIKIQLIEQLGKAEATIAELVEHVNSLPEGHYSPWLSWWAKEASSK